MKNGFRIDVNVSTVGTVCFGVAIILGSITESLGSVILSGGVVCGISGNSSSIVNIKEY